MVSNELKTVGLLALLTALALWIGTLFGQGGFYIAIALVLIMNVASYFFSDKIALTMYRAKEVSKKEQPELHALVEEVARRADIPKPRVYVIPTHNPNAFATGRNPKNGVVAVTVGLMKLLNRREMKGVIAHEIAHIKNRDILITSVTAMIAGVISYIATMAQWAAIFGGFGGRDDNGGGIVELLVMIILAPLLAMIIRMAVSRTREYIADESAARYIKDRDGLADALLKLEHGAKIEPLKFGPEGGESLFIVNPFTGRSFLKLLSTHPPTEERVKRLRALKL